MPKHYESHDIVLTLVKRWEMGSTGDDILALLTSPVDDGGYGYKQSFAYELRKRAYDMMMERIKEKNVDMYMSSMSQMIQLYERAVKKGKDELALQVIKEMNKINGLYVNRIETKNTTIITKWGDEPDELTNDDPFLLD